MDLTIVKIPIDPYFKDTKTMTIQRVKTQQYCGQYQPFARHFGGDPLYFKTHYRANRESDIIKINPTQYHLQCIIHHFLGIPSCPVYTRHNIFSFILTKDCKGNDIVLGKENIDQWDSSDMIQSPTTRNNSLRTLIFMNIMVLYENNQMRRRLNQRQPKCLNLIRAD